MDALRWTTHMDDCLDTLDRERQHPTDEVLVRLVRLQLVAEEAQRLMLADVADVKNANQVPSYVYKKSLLSRLQKARSFSNELTTNRWYICTPTYLDNRLIMSSHLTMPFSWCRGYCAFGRVDIIKHASHPAH